MRQSNANLKRHEPAGKLEQATVALQQSEQQHRAILRTAMDGFWRVDMKGRLLEVNEAYCRMSGYSEHELLAMSISDLEDAETPAGTSGHLRRILAQGAERFESRHRRKDGSTFAVEISVQSKPAESGHMIAFLRDITERKQVEKALRASLQEKESLLKEIHHRVKSNLQIVSSMMRLQSGRPQHPEAKRVLLAMQNRVQAMALIHEHLYQTENLATVDLSDYLKRLCAHLVHAVATPPQTVEFHRDIVPLRVGIDQAIPCGLLVNELVSNCLKHAFPGGRAGEMSVVLQPMAAGPEWRLRIADNGVGLPAGFDMNTLTSVGLRLVPGLARQMGGKLEIGEGPGTVFEVVFTPGILVVKQDEQMVKTSNKSPRVNQRARKRMVP